MDCFQPLEKRHKTWKRTNVDPICLPYPHLKNPATSLWSFLSSSNNPFVLWFTYLFISILTSKTLVICFYGTGSAIQCRSCFADTVRSKQEKNNSKSHSDGFLSLVAPWVWRIKVSNEPMVEITLTAGVFQLFWLLLVCLALLMPPNNHGRNETSSQCLVGNTSRTNPMIFSGILCCRIVFAVFAVDL